jgi:hypothetical protein
MIQKRTSNPLFFVQCGDWETVRLARTPLDACIDAMREARNKYGDAIKTSSIVIAMDLHRQMEQDEDAISAYRLESVISPT